MSERGDDGVAVVERMRRMRSDDAGAVRSS